MIMMITIIIKFCCLSIWGSFIEILTTSGDTSPSHEGTAFGAWMCATIKQLCSFKYMDQTL